jgi:DNA-binding transcriptional LysR family regulator
MEADSEAIITSLVFAGVGLGLMREDLALEAQKAGKAFVLPNGEATATLMLLHAKGRTDDPAIEALVAAVREVWAVGADVAHAVTSPQGVMP